MINLDRLNFKADDERSEHPFKNWESVVKAYERNQEELRKIAQCKPCNDSVTRWEKAESKLLADQFKLVEAASRLPIEDHRSALYALLLWESENKGIEGSEESFPLVESVKNFIKTQA